jgi:leader peptidase (prepilin peptidase)/N-methyltransferase
VIDSIEILPHLVFEILLFILGGVIGSFLNVVIYRLPIMLQHKWENDCAILSGNEPTKSSFNLMYPRSHCRDCLKKIPEWANIPLIGFLILKGKCYFCKAKISKRYPFVELLTGGLFVIAGCYFSGVLFLGLLLYISFVICLVFIDYDNFILPDELTLPLLWLGLLFNIHGVLSGSLENAVIGAALGYFVLWSIYWGFKLITKKDGMGYGDFKFLAAILAWSGYQALIPVTFIASILGIIYFVIIIISDKIKTSGNIKNALQHHIPFGPFLGLASLLFIFLVHSFESSAWLKDFLELPNL